MKANYWIIIIIVTSAIVFAVGRNTSQQVTPGSDEVVDLKSRSNDQEISHLLLLKATTSGDIRRCL